MVLYHSQYRKHFKDPHWDEHALSEYNRKVDYRLGRRSVEHFHQPWDWESQDESSDSEASSEQQPRVSKEKVEVRDVAVEAKERRHKKQHRKDRDSTRKCTVDASKKTQQERKTSARKRTGENASRKVEKSARNKSKELESSKGPFLSYGWANEGPLDKKYTYNVRASPTEVYPASMRALKRRELDVKRRLFESQKKATKEEAILREKMFKDARASATFLTEYQRSFCLQNI